MIRMKAVLKKFSKFHRFAIFKYLITYERDSKAINSNADNTLRLSAA